MTVQPITNVPTDQQGHDTVKKTSIRAAFSGLRTILGRRTSTTGRRGRVIAVAIVAALAATVSIFGASVARADDDTLKYSFYKIASSTTAFFSTIQEPDSASSFSDDWVDLIADPGSAGSLLGYADPQMSSVSGWLMSKLSGSSDAIGYETLFVRDENGEAIGSTFQGMVDYAYFGAALKGMGLDGTSTGLSLDFMNWLSGGVVLVLFMLGGAVDFVFNAIISVLAMLNPFKLFHIAIESINPTLAAGMVGDETVDVGPLSGLVNWIGGWYKALSSLAWGVMVPIFLAVLIVGLLLFKKLDRGSAVKKFIVRLLFIGIGLPLIGSMYTGTLDSMTAATEGSGAGSSRVVMSTYVDFESWATKSRLAVPDGATIEWDTSSNQPSGKAQGSVRNTALAINNKSLGLSLNAIVSADSFDASFAKQVMDGEKKDAKASENTFVKTADMLLRYIGGAKVSAASFETIAKGDLSQSTYYSGNRDSVKGWFENLTKDANGLNEIDPTTNPLVAVKDGTGLRANGSVVRKFSSDTAGCSVTGTSITLSSGEPRACNLSPVALYNFLNTDFGSTSMQMYSSSNVASEATRSIHNSVNQVGTGAMSFIYWINAVVLLGSFVLIGLGYAFALLFGSIRRSFQIVAAVPFATIGALAAIAKVIVYSLALILEVLLTVFIYKMVQEFLTSLPQIIEMPFAAVLNNGAAGDFAGFIAFLVNGWGFSMVVTLLSITGIIIFTVLAMRVRKGFVKAVEEAVTKIVEKFLDSQVGMPSGSGKGGALAGGLAAGAGAALTNRAMNKSGGKAAIAGAKGDGKNGPAGIVGAGGVAPGGPTPGGGNGTLEITGRVDGADGNGDPGAPVGELPSGGGSGAATSETVASEVALGRQVEAQGLSKPGEGSAEVQGDALSAASGSLESTAEGYREADRRRLAAGTEGAAAVGHAGLAIGRGVAGDAPGAIESGGKAVQAGGNAVSAGQAAKDAEAEASRSSLDAPKPRSSRTQEGAQRVSQVGGTVAGVAGVASATGGAGSSAQAANTSRAAEARGRKQAGEQAAKSKPAPRPQSTPSQPQGQRSTAGSAPKPQAAPAPRPQHAAPTAAPSGATAPARKPAPAKAPKPQPTQSPRSAPTAPGRKPAPTQVPKPAPQRAPQPARGANRLAQAAPRKPQPAPRAGERPRDSDA